MTVSELVLVYRYEFHSHEAAKEQFYILIPVVLFCAYSVAYLIRSVLVAF